MSPVFQFVPKILTKVYLFTWKRAGESSRIGRLWHIFNIGESVCDSSDHSAVTNVGKERGHDFVTRENKDYY